MWDGNSFLNSFFPNRIDGEKFHFFYRNDDNKTYLAELSIYKSGNIEITNLPKKKIYKFEDLFGNRNQVYFPK